MEPSDWLSAVLAGKCDDFHTQDGCQLLYFEEEGKMDAFHGSLFIL